MKTIAKFNGYRPGHFSNLFDSILKTYPYYENEFSNHFPPVNISETQTSFGIELQVPGFKKEDFKLEVQENTLTVSSSVSKENNESTKDETTYSRKEFNLNSFKRVFTLPETADKQKIEAKYENGILALTIAKKEIEKQEKTIEIKVS